MAEEFTKNRRRSCFLVCISLLVLFGTILGFLAGLLVGGLMAKQGHFTSVLTQGEIVSVCPGVNTQMADGDPVISEEGSESACAESSNTTRAGGGEGEGECSVCGEARLLLVSGASYAECDGVYSLTSLSSVWDSKHIVYSRLEGGDNRYIV